LGPNLQILMIPYPRNLGTQWHFWTAVSQHEKNFASHSPHG